MAVRLPPRLQVRNPLLRQELPWLAAELLLHQLLIRLLL